MGFKENYIQMKEDYKTDKEIAKEWEMDLTTLRRRKRLYDVPDIRKPRYNEQGLTEEELKKGESIGLTRKLMLQRVRLHRWSNERAILTPRREKTDKRGRKFK